MNMWRLKSSSAIFGDGGWRLIALTAGPPGTSPTARAAPANSSPLHASTPMRARLIVFIASLPKIYIQTLDPAGRLHRVPMDGAVHCSSDTCLRNARHLACDLA